MFDVIAASIASADKGQNKGQKPIKKVSLLPIESNLSNGYFCNFLNNFTENKSTPDETQNPVWGKIWGRGENALFRYELFGQKTS